MKKSTRQKPLTLIICFLLPVFIMACYFAYRNMSPFGNQSILTVDLGQQYVDLFAYFRHVLLTDPSGIFYSFAKAFGGEMLGTWAYYLLSPVNLLLLLIPKSSLPAGVLIITLFKYGLSGLSFGYLLKQTINPRATLTIMWALIYALNGWIIANQLNLMWLDGMIWLPLIILGINQIFKDQYAKTYLVAMTLTIITNYYMAYMITLFIIIYVSFKLITTKLTAHQFKSINKSLISSTFTSLGLTAWLTLPTIFSLIKGKAHYSHPNFKFGFEYSPFKMFSKLFNGSLNFEQLPHGLPNIFIGSVALIGFLLYFCQNIIPLRKKLGTLSITLILVLSMCYQPLDLLWHGGQFPIWYPYRFSFIFCFWTIWTAARAINHHYSINWKMVMIITIILALLIIYIFLNLTSFSFISPLNFIIGILFLVTSYILLLYTHNSSRLFSVALLILSTFEMSLNVFNSLNNLSYISNNSYTNYTRQLSNEINTTRTQHHQPFRISKTFYRSKDDSFSNYYMDGNTFDSSLEYSTPRFMKRIGQPESQGFVTYTEGTILTDQLLDYRYSLTTHDHHHTKFFTNRPDLINYPVIKKGPFNIHQNPSVLPFVFPTQLKALRIKFTSNPITNQERWYQAITGNNQARFKAIHFQDIHKHNLKIKGNQLETINPFQSGNVSLTIWPKFHHANYLLIGPQFNDQNCQLTLDHHQILPKTSYQHPIILNLTSGNKTKPVQLNIRILKHQLHRSPFTIYQINQNRLLQPHHIHSKVNFISNRKLTGQFKATHKNPVMGSSIPATKGWHLKIDGHIHPIHKIAGEFIGAHVRPGRHHFQLTYTPPLFKLGSLISLITLISLLTKYLDERLQNKKIDH